MGIVCVNGVNFWEQGNCWEQTKNFVKDGVVQKKTYDEQTIWIVWKDKKQSFFNERKKTKRTI